MTDERATKLEWELDRTFDLGCGKVRVQTDHDPDGTMKITVVACGIGTLPVREGDKEDVPGGGEFARRWTTQTGEWLFANRVLSITMYNRDLPELKKILEEVLDHAGR